MDKKRILPEDYNKPVAYDVNGQPLYAHPPVAEGENDVKSQIVHVMRQSEPAKQMISDATKLKHLQSKKGFSNLKPK